MMHRAFADPDLALALLPHAFDRRDGAHDEAHLLRVWRNAERIMAAQGGDAAIVQAATLLHDCIHVDKASPARATASRLAAGKAREVLSALCWGAGRIGQVCHAIEAHSHSAAIEAVTLEARIPQDADRLDAMGFIGIARCFYLAGMRRAMAAARRPLDDAAYALDHFWTKLLGLGDAMRTATGRRMAEERAARLRDCYCGLLAEVG